MNRTRTIYTGTSRKSGRILRMKLLLTLFVILILAGTVWISLPSSGQGWIPNRSAAASPITITTPAD